MHKITDINLEMPIEGLVELMKSCKGSAFTAEFLGEGVRNDTLTSVAGFLHRKHGLSGEALATQLCILNAGQDNPLPDAEVWQIAESISKKNDGLPGFDEVTVSRAFARHVSGYLRYAAGRGWMHYDGTRWRSDASGKLVQEACKRFAELVKEQYTTALSESDDQERPRIEKAYKSACGLLAAAKVKKVYELAASDDLILCQIDAFDRNPNLLNCRNGTVDLETGELKPHDPADLITKVANVVYDPQAGCPTFRRVMAQLLPEDHAAFLLRYLGYAMTATAHEQAFLIAFGPGLNGKSTIVNAVGDLLGDYTVRADPETFCGRLQGAVRNDLARMAGARLAVTAELPMGVPLDAALVKAMTGGEKLTVRFLHKEFFEMAPEFALVMVTNYLPVVNGNDNALYRRVLLLPFEVCVPENQIDKRLPQKLAEEASGILNMLMVGLTDYRAYGLAVPQELKDRASDYLKQSNLIELFFGATFTRDEGNSIPSSWVYRRYTEWAREHGYKPLANGTFNAEFKKLDGVRFVKTNRGNFWCGVQLKPYCPMGVEAVEANFVVPDNDNEKTEANNLASTPSTGLKGGDSD